MKQGIRLASVCLLVSCWWAYGAYAGIGPEQPPEIRYLSLTTVPITTQVPQYGGMVVFDFMVTSVGQADTADVWFDLGLPDGQVIGPYYAWMNYIFGAGQTALKHCLLYISPMCMPNTYSIYARCGTHCSWQIADADSFDFNKAVSSDPPGLPQQPALIQPHYSSGLGEGTLIVTDGATEPKLHLLAVAPQPCNPEATISYAVAQAGPVKVSLYDVKGSRVYHQVLNADAPGDYSLNLRTADFASGSYILSLEQGGTLVQRPLVILK